MTKKEDKTYSIDDLAKESGVNRRTIRFYIQEDLLDKPIGLGRYARYTDAHLEKLKSIKARGDDQPLSDFKGPQLPRRTRQGDDEPIAPVPSSRLLPFLAYGAPSILPDEQPAPQADPAAKVAPEKFDTFTQVVVAPGVNVSVSDRLLAERQVDRQALAGLKDDIADLLQKYRLS